MSDEHEQQSNISVSIPIGALATVAIVGAAVAAYILSNRDSEDGEGVASRTKGRAGGVRRRLGLMTVITLIENDATRKVVLAVLRAMARRA